MSFIESASIILRHGSHFFLIQRSENSRYWPNYWGFPGGKKEENEDIFSAAKRELQEETGVSVEKWDIIATIVIDAQYIDGDRKNTLFLFDNWGGVPENLESKIHSDLWWFTLDDLPSPMIPHIKKWFFALLDGKQNLIYNGI